MQKFWPFVSGALAATLGAVLIHSSPSTAAAARGPTLEDRQAIDNLLARYSTGLDTLQPDLYVSTFTEDASFGEGDRARHGRTEIRKVITELIDSRAKRAEEAAKAAPTPAAAPAAGAPAGPPAGPPVMHHVITNNSLEFLNDHQARHRAYWMTVIGSGRSFTVAGMGRYEDELVKKDGQWLFSSRKITR
jgi:hypothetical protein